MKAALHMHFWSGVLLGAPALTAVHSEPRTKLIAASPRHPHVHAHSLSGMPINISLRARARTHTHGSISDKAAYQNTLGNPLPYTHISMTEVPKKRKSQEKEWPGPFLSKRIHNCPQPTSHTCLHNSSTRIPTSS